MLTTTPINVVLRSGKAEHSALAEKFIGAAFEQLGITITACYMQSHRHLVLPQDMTLQNLLKKQKPAFTDEIILTLYILNKNTSVCVQDDTVKERLFELFMSLTEAEGIEIPYTRLYLPEEMAYYGWNHQRREQWDLTKIIEPDELVTNQHTVLCEYIDRLSLNNLLRESLSMLNRSEMIENHGGRVYCGYDSKRDNMAYYLVLPSKQLPCSELEHYKNQLIKHALKLLKSRDVWHILNDSAVKPIICTWSELSDALRYSLLRG